MATKEHPKNWKNSHLYKTILCESWVGAKECKFGMNCWYAHGSKELRIRNINGGGHQAFFTGPVSPPFRNFNDEELDLGGLLSDCSALAEPFVNESKVFHMQSNAPRHIYGAIGEEVKRKRYNANGGSNKMPGQVPSISCAEKAKKQPSTIYYDLFTKRCDMPCDLLAKLRLSGRL